MSGPYYPLENIFLHVIRLLRTEKSVEGEKTLDEIFCSGAEAVFGIEHFNAVLPDGNMMKIEVLREENPEVVAALPGDVWCIVATRSADADVHLADSDTRLKMKEMVVRGTFTTNYEANRAAERLLQYLKLQAGWDAYINRHDSNGRVCGNVIPPGVRFEMVEVKDSHVETQPLGTPFPYVG